MISQNVENHVFGGTSRVKFTFELTPIKVKKTERRGGSLLSFFTRCAALIGGLFTVAGILDASLYHSSKKLKKMQEGRQD